MSNANMDARECQEITPFTGPEQTFWERVYLASLTRYSGTQSAQNADRAIIRLRSRVVGRGTEATYR